VTEEHENNNLLSFYVCSGEWFAEAQRSRARPEFISGAGRRPLSNRSFNEVSFFCMFTPRPIAVVRSPYKISSEIPKGLGAKHDAEGVVEVMPEFELGLADVEGFSHLFLIWIFDRADGFDLTANPPSDNRPHGVFATRSPRRPNPIGLTVVELLGREGAKLRVRGIDMLDGTPVLDIKPYLSSVPAEALRRGWLAEAEARKQGNKQAS
jgi:tRNA-Thr(GGU) m(6)t(6)A37 methyltransferase TsaA